MNSCLSWVNQDLSALYRQSSTQWLFANPTTDQLQMQLNQSQTDELTQCSLAAGWLRPGQAIQRLEQAGEGNMNVVLRGYLNDGTSLVFKQALTYVAKYPHIAAPIERLDAELNFYASIADDQDLAARCPTIVGYDGDNHLLCMQDLGKVGDFTDLYQLDSAGVHTAQMQDLATLVTWLGQLHQHHVPPPPSTTATQPRHAPVKP